MEEASCSFMVVSWSWWFTVLRFREESPWWEGKPESVLSWVHVVAMLGQFSVLDGVGDIADALLSKTIE